MREMTNRLNAHHPGAFFRFVVVVFMTLCFQSTAFGADEDCYRMIQWDEQDYPETSNFEGTYRSIAVEGRENFTYIRYYLITDTASERLLEVMVQSYQEAEDGDVTALGSWNELIDSPTSWTKETTTASDYTSIAIYDPDPDEGHTSMKVYVLYKDYCIIKVTAPYPTHCHDTSTSCDPESSLANIYAEYWSVASDAMAMIDAKCGITYPDEPSDEDDPDTDEYLILESADTTSTLIYEGEGVYDLTLEYHDFISLSDFSASCWGGSDSLLIHLDSGLPPYTTTLQGTGSAAVDIRDNVYQNVVYYWLEVTTSDKNSAVGDMTITLTDSTDISSDIKVHIVESHFSRFALYDQKTVLYIPYLKLGNFTLAVTLKAVSGANGELELVLDSYRNQTTYSGQFDEFIAEINVEGDADSLPDYALTIPHFYYKNGMMYKVVLMPVRTKPDLTFGIKSIDILDVWPG